MRKQKKSCFSDYNNTHLLVIMRKSESLTLAWAKYLYLAKRPFSIFWRKRESKWIFKQAARLKKNNSASGLKFECQDVYVPRQVCLKTFPKRLHAVNKHALTWPSAKWGNEYLHKTFTLHWWNWKMLGDGEERWDGTKKMAWRSLQCEHFIEKNRAVNSGSEWKNDTNIH